MNRVRHEKIGLFTTIALLASGSAAIAGDVRGVTFTHHDWELVCDNTRTCRAAGYQPLPGGDVDDGDSDSDAAATPLPVSVLLTRKAGPGEPVAGELHVGHYGEDTTSTYPGKRSLKMLIDAKPLGEVEHAQGQWIAQLTRAQTEALLAALLRRSRIEWTDGKRTWRLSDKGANAVMLKMDEFQGRLRTPGALVSKGGRDERDVLPAVPAPVVVAAGVPIDDRVELPASSQAALRKALAAASGDECPALADPRDATDPIYARRLSATRLVATATCWRGASTVAEAYWLINAAPPFAPKIVTTRGQEYANGKLHASTWDGGYDCMRSEEWTWDGRRFVQTKQGTGGMCREIEMGGAWSLPTIVTDVRRAPVRR